jgi:hypothetical protein
MSGVEPLIAAEAAAATTAAAAANTAAVTAAEIAAAEAASVAAAEAAATTAATTAAETAAAEAAATAASEAAATAGSQTAAEALASEAAAKTLEQQAFENFLRFGPEADMSGATMRSISAGLQNAPLNTITSLPQYMGMPAMPPGAGQALQMARLMSPQQQGGTRTSVSPPMLNKGREVNLGAPIAGLLGGAQMPRRRRLSLI